MYADRNPPQDQPCGSCRVELMPENADAYGIFRTVRYQFIMGFSGPVDINHSAIHEAMRLYGIEDKKKCFEKVLTLGRWWLNKISERKGDG